MMEKNRMRLFVGLEPSPAFRKALAELQGRLRAAGVGGRYLEIGNLHMTLAFIGMWTEDAAALLPTVGEPFPITLSCLGVFPKAKVLWAGVDPSEALNALAEQARRSLAEADVPFDPQPFNPHITLARKPVIPDGLNLSQIETPRAAMLVNDVCLYRSEPGENGARYSVIARGPRPSSAERKENERLRMKMIL